VSDTPNMQKHRDVAEALIELWPCIRDLPSLVSDAIGEQSRVQAFRLGEIESTRAQLQHAVQWYVLRVTGELVSIVRPQQEAKP
jgi:hypothetical protein